MTENFSSPASICRARRTPTRVLGVRARSCEYAFKLLHLEYGRYRALANLVEMSAASEGRFQAYEGIISRLGEDYIAHMNEVRVSIRTIQADLSAVQAIGETMRITSTNGVYG